jgi:lipopolysaccharide transport protein LptA
MPARTTASDRVARSSTLELALQPKLAAAASAHFLGSVTFTDGTWMGEAPEGRYDPERGVLTLSTTKENPGVLPRAWDDRVTIDAELIELALPRRQLLAERRVQSVFRPALTDRRAQRGEGTVRVPTLLSDDQPLYVTTGKLLYDEKASAATYSGHARLWQGESLIRGESLVLDDQRGNLSVSGQAYSRLSIGEARGAASARTIGEGREMQYDDATRRAVYRGKAHVNGPDGDLRGERIELFLDETGRELVRAEAYDEVSVKLEGGFSATGKRLSYLADTQRYHMQGSPVRILEEKPSECRETTGAVLTFTRSIDSISVDGTDGNRSRTRPVPCAERRH